MEYLRNILAGLVDNPDKLRVTETLDEMGVLLTVSVAPEDMGRILGKQGTTAQAIRAVLKVYGYAQNRRQNISIKILEPEY